VIKNKVENSGAATNFKVSKAQSAGTVFCRAIFDSTSTICRFGEPFRDG